MKRFTTLVMLALLLATAGCATFGAKADPAVTDPTAAGAVADATPLGKAFANLKSDAVVDLDQAQAIAVAANDEVAMACYPVLKDWLVGVLGTSKPTVAQIKGVFSAFEAARTTRLKVEGAVGAGPTIPVKVKLGCAALLQDERLFALRLAALIGGASVGAPGVSNLLLR